MKLLRWHIVSDRMHERLHGERADAINCALDAYRNIEDVRIAHAAVCHALSAALATGPSVPDAAIMLIGQRADLTANQREDARTFIGLYRPGGAACEK